MVAAQVFFALCAASMVVAAPQLNLPALRSTSSSLITSSNVNEEEVVSSVVTALGPSISQAVADALASIEAAAAAEEAARIAAEQQAREEAEARARAEAARIAAQQRAAAEQAARQRAAAEQAARQRAAAEQAARERAAAAAAAAAAAEPSARPVYNFEYKVADNEAQTYISQSEARDGDSLTGTYSYVNPVGSLITVEYQAGPEGYTQTSSEQAGFVQIRAKQDNGAAEAARLAAEQRARAQAEQRARAEAARIAAEQRARAEAARIAAEQRAAAEAARIAAEQRAAEEAARIAAEQRAAEEAARLAAEQAAAQQALISRIISSIQPQIGSAVQSAISSSQTVVAPAPVARVIPVAATGDVSTTFGNGFSVKIDTPEFNIEY